MKAKKSLGQNFLKSQLALKKIIEAGEISSDDIILEIGPGKGALTEKLLEKAHLVVAVEKDRELFEFLKIKFEKEISEKKLILIKDDILKFEFNSPLEEYPKGEVDIHPGFQPPLKRGISTLSRKRATPQEGNNNYKLIANIPYNITGAILKKFLTEKNQPSLMVLMVQNEVAKRIVASPRHSGASKKESILSISVKAYGEPKMIMKVPARYFSPAPKVDSAVIAIKNISRRLFNSPLEEYPEALPQGEVDIHPGFQPPLKRGISTLSRLPTEQAGKRATPQEGNFEDKFWQIVHAGFAHKRKKLSNNLKNLPENLKNKRAEDLSLEDWINLAKN